MNAPTPRPTTAAKHLAHTGAVLGGSLLLTAVALRASALAAEPPPYPVFDTAPPPERLAGLLFPPRYRGVGAPAGEEETPAEFGMLIRFAFDSSEILPESETLLQSLGEMLGMPSALGRSIVIEGHTDAIGDEAYNQRLSERRARAIREHLVERYGVESGRLLAVGKGERQPLDTDEPTAAVNRRAGFRAARRVVLK